MKLVRILEEDTVFQEIDEENLEMEISNQSFSQILKLEKMIKRIKAFLKNNDFIKNSLMVNPLKKTF